MNTVERFMSKVSPDPNSGCWLWIGYVSPFGYGQFSIKTCTSKRIVLHIKTLWGLFPKINR